MRLGMRLFPLSSPVVMLFDFIHVIFTFAFIVCLLLRSLVFQFFSVCFHFFLLPFSHHCFFTFCFLEFLHSFHFFQIILQISSRSLQIKKHKCITVYTSAVGYITIAHILHIPSYTLLASISYNPMISQPENFLVYIPSTLILRSYARATWFQDAVDLHKRSMFIVHGAQNTARQK